MAHIRSDQQARKYSADTCRRKDRIIMADRRINFGIVFFFDARSDRGTPQIEITASQGRICFLQTHIFVEAAFQQHLLITVIQNDKPAFRADDKISVDRPIAQIFLRLLPAENIRLNSIAADRKVRPVLIALLINNACLYLIRLRALVYRLQSQRKQRRQKNGQQKAPKQQAAHAANIFDFTPKPRKFHLNFLPCNF